jgi:beta-mannanase
MWGSIDSQIKRFRELTGRHPAIVSDYFDFSHGFPLGFLGAIERQGCLPLVTWDPKIWEGNRRAGLPDEVDLTDIIAGKWDGYIRSWARDARSFGGPLFIRWAHEMNGDWYPYSGAFYGGGSTDRFDPSRFDGPEVYALAYLRVHGIFQTEGATNVSWVFSPNVLSFPDESWNEPRRYIEYIGPENVDWIGFDGYNWGDHHPGEPRWRTPEELFAPITSRFLSYGLPMMIAETASAEAGGDKAEWVGNLYRSAQSLGLRGVVYTDFDDKGAALVIESSGASTQAFREALSNPYFQDAQAY